MVSPGYSRAAAVTPSDADANIGFGFTQKALYIGGAGAIAVRTSRGDDVTLSAIPVGTTIYLQVNRVKSTGTTATNIVALGDG